MSSFDFKFGLKFCFVIGLLLTILTIFTPTTDLSQSECGNLIQKNACPGVNHRISGLPFWVRHTWEEKTYTLNGSTYETKIAWRNTVGGQVEQFGLIPRSSLTFIIANYLIITSLITLFWYIFYQFIKRR